MSADWGGPAAPQWEDPRVLGGCGEHSRSSPGLGHSSLSSRRQRRPLALLWAGSQGSSYPSQLCMAVVSMGRCRKGEPVTAGLSASADPAWPQSSCLCCPVEIHGQSWGLTPSLRAPHAGLCFHANRSSVSASFEQCQLSAQAKPALALHRERAIKLGVVWQQHCYFSPSTRSGMWLSSDTNRHRTGPAATTRVSGPDKTPHPRASSEGRSWETPAPAFQSQSTPSRAQLCPMSPMLDARGSIPNST